MIENEYVEILKDKIDEVREVLFKQIEDITTKNNDS